MSAMPSRVLVVEDDAILALSLETALRDAGVAEVTICASSAQAMEALRAGGHDALVIDVHLADRHDGWAIAELVAEVDGRAPRVVFSTGAPADIPPAIAELGMVLEKPYEPAALVEALRSRQRTGLITRFLRPPA